LVAIEPEGPIDTHTQVRSNVASLIEFIDSASAKRKL
jgi:hypothetical protein